MDPIISQTYDIKRKDMKIVINDFSSKIKNCENRQYFCTNDFQVDNISFKIMIYPNKDGHVAAYI